MWNNDNGKNKPGAAEESVHSRFTVPPFGSHENNQLTHINAETFPLNKLRVTTPLPGLRACVRAWGVGNLSIKQPSVHQHSAVFLGSAGVSGTARPQTRGPLGFQQEKHSS